jgi:CRP-like cAMP-binding protein
VSHLHQTSLRNRILRALSPEGFALLQPHLEPIDIRLREILLQAGEVINDVFFIESGICSVLAQIGQTRFEVGMVGREGMVGVPVLLGLDRAPQSLMVQADGQALRLSSDALREVIRQDSGLNQKLLSYVHCFMTQAMQTAYANADFTIEERLARWVIMTHDRLQTDELPLTHDFLAMMLGNRRSGITNAIHVLEGEGLIRATRGLIKVRNRQKLEERAGSAYGVAEGEYDRLFPEKAELSHASVLS